MEDRLSSSESEDEWDLGLLLFILWGGLLIIMDTILENLIDDRSLNQSTSTHISWRDLPNQEEEGLGNFFYWDFGTFSQCSTAACSRN